MNFEYPDNALVSRNYDPAEKELPYFQDVRRNLCRLDAFRDWEYPAALAAMGIDSEKKYLCIGGFGDALGVFLSHHVQIDVIDRVTMQAVKDYPLSYGQYWHNQTNFMQGDWADCAGGFGLYDVIFSIGSIEHNFPDRDILCMWHIGQHLKPGGIAVITIEWGEQYAYDYDLPELKQVVGGHIYNLEAIQKRLVEPSGLTMTEWQQSPVNWDEIAKGAPFIKRGVVPFCPGLVILKKDG